MKPYHTIAFVLLFSFSANAQSIENVKRLSNYSYSNSYQNYNSSLFFSFDNALWKTGGDSNSTIIVKQFSYDIKSLMVWNGKLYFFADDGQSGWELWLSDGTTQGTQLVKDINPGPSSAVMTKYFDNKLTVYNNTLYFPADDSTHGRELWRTDGTTAGTYMVIDIDTTNSLYHGLDGLQTNIAIANNKLFFNAIDNNDSLRVWVSDGTASGTHPINTVKGADIFYTYNNKIFFYGISADSNGADFGRDGLFSTDGTEAGTHLVFDSVAWLTKMFAVMNNKLYFLANKLQNGTSYSLYVTDGTTAGTSIFKDTVIPSLPIPNLNNQLCVYNNHLYFANISNQNVQLWKSDGTASGTQQLTTSSYDLTPCQFLVANGLLYFKGFDTSHVELWSTDGNASNTKVVETLGNGYSWTQQAFSLWSPIYQYNNYLFFGNFYNADTVYSLYKYQLYPDAIANVPNIAKTEVYPNPAQDFIYYKSEVQSMVAYDINGKQVAQASSNRLDIKAFAPGAYFVLIETAKGTQFARFIKE